MANRSPLSRRQIDEFRRQLLENKQALTAQLDSNENFGLSTPISDVIGDSSIDNHPADQGTAMFERAKDLALNERVDHTLSEIDQALDRIDSDQYGRCLECGKPIPLERLEALPYTPYCIDHAKEQNISQNRPIEESFLAHPFGRNSLDEHEDTQFDAEDAWQIVSQWGTSNTPALAEQNNVDDYGEMYIESEEPDGYVEPIESFLATDLFGRKATIVRNDEYHQYLANAEGEPLLEAESDEANPPPYS